MTRSCGWRNLLHNAKGYSASGILSRAIGIMIVYAALHLAGLREYAAIISGTVPIGPFSQTVSQLFAVTYVLFYLGAVVLSPILIIAALVMFLVEKCPCHGHDEKDVRGDLGQ